MYDPDITRYQMTHLDSQGGLSRFRRVVDACDEFESSWKSGRRPAIESWVRSMTPTDREVFLKELLELEIELRLLGGEVPTFSEYQGRFPSDQRLVERVFNGLCQPLPGPPDLDFEMQEPTPPRLPDDKSLGWVGRYELLARIGGGGMGVVFRALQHDAKRIVALKLIRPDLVGGAFVGLNVEAIERFRNEATATARLKHANIVTVHDVGEFGGRPYYVMEYIEGKSLSELLADGPIEDETAARYLEQISRAVHQAHLLSLLHRDIKPGNILIDNDGKPLITDFGLVKLLDHSPQPSMTSGPLGTPCYMSPEQARCDPNLGPTSDVYNIGATLYEMITGRPPFRAASNLITLRQVCEEEPAPPRSLNPAISRNLETICLKCLQKEPSKRYESAEALADDFQHLLKGEPIKARPVGAIVRMALWAKRNPKVASLSMMVYVLLTMLAVGLTTLVVKLNDALRVATQSLIKQNLTQALPIVTGPRTSDALPLLAEAIRLEEKAGVLSEASKARLAAVIRESPKPIRIWAREGPIRDAILSPKGRLVATVSGNEAELWNVESDRRINSGAFHHGSRINGLAFSPDETLVATAEENGHARIWEVGSGRCRHKINVSNKPVDDIVFSPDGKTIVVAADKVAQGWSVETGKPWTPPLHHADRINAIAFSPDGKTLAAAVGGPNLGRIGGVALWDLSDTAAKPVLLDHTDDVYSIAFSADGQTLVTGSYDRNVRIWNTSTFKVVKQWDLQASVSRVAISPDGLRVAAATESLLHLIDVEGEQRSVPLNHPGNLLTIRFSSDGRKVAAAGDDWTARVWDFSTRELLLPALIHNARVNSIAFSPDNRYLLTASEDHTARLWDLAGGQGPSLAISIQPGAYEPLAQAASSRDGRRILAIGHDGVARVFDSKSGRPISAPLKFGELGLDAAFHPDGEIFATLDQDRRVSVWNVQTGAKIYAIPETEGEIVALAFSKDGRRFITAGNIATDGSARPDGIVCVRDAENGATVRGPMHTGSRINGIATNARATLIATYNRSGVVQIWKALDGKPLDPPFQHPDGINKAVFSPNGQMLATAGKDGKGRLWLVDSGSQLGKPLLHDQAINDITFSADGRRVATAGQDRFARVWDAFTTNPIGRPMLHEYDVQTVSFSNEGRYLVTASGSSLRGGRGESIVWEAATGYRVNKPIRHEHVTQFSRCNLEDSSFLSISRENAQATAWRLPQSLLPTAELLKLAAIVSGLEVDGNDSVMPIPANALAEAHRQFRVDNPSAFKPPLDDLLQWHDLEAASCERQKLWKAALVHLDALVEGQPYARNSLARRGWVHGELGHWKQAKNDFERATEGGHGELEIWYSLQVLRVVLGDRAGYRAGCETLQKRRGTASSAWERNTLAYICSLHPDGLSDYEPLLKMTNFGNSLFANDPDCMNTRAALLFRVKHYEEALAVLQSLKAIDGDAPRSARALSSELLLIMTYARLNRHDEARTHFAALEPMVKEIVRSDRSEFFQGWQERLHIESLVRETRELLKARVQPPRLDEASSRNPASDPNPVLMMKR